MKKDIHGLVNLIIGTALALFAGIYYAETPKVALVVIGVSSTFLIARECWVFGGRERWSLTPISDIAGADGELPTDSTIKKLAAELYKDMLNNIDRLAEVLQKQDKVNIELLSDKEKNSLIMDFLRTTMDAQFHKVSDITSGMSPVEAYHIKMVLTEMVWRKLNQD